MSAPTPCTSCEECGADVAQGLLACPGCARLVHGAELERLASSARAAEQAGQPGEALASWRGALELLPAGSTQQAAIVARMKALRLAVDGGRSGDSKGRTGRGAGAKTGAAAGAGAAGLALLKSKALLAALLANGKLLLLGLTKLPTLLSMLIYMHWWSGRGAGFGAGIVASIYVHEIGHVAALQRYGIEASAPMFVPGFGALVRMKQYPTDAHEEARTGLAGPLWGLFAAGVAWALGLALTWPVALRIASVGATINLFNLVPVWQLDGARGLRALSRRERIALAAIALVAGVAFHQWMPAVVGAVTAARAFGADGHEIGDRRVLALFASLVVALALLATLPGLV